MDQNTSWETNHSSIDQVFAHVLWSPEVNTNVSYRPTVLLIPRQIQPLPSTILFIQDIFKVTFALPFITRFSKNISMYFTAPHTRIRGTPSLTKLCILKLADILNCNYCNITENLFFFLTGYDKINLCS